ncbi:MAG: PTS transporter subunit IIC, partial [Bacilli bacterium]
MSGIFGVILDILSQPSIIIGIVVVLGLVLQGKKGSEIVTPAVKAVVGYLILASAATVITNSLDPLGQM